MKYPHHAGSSKIIQEGTVGEGPEEDRGQWGLGPGGQGGGGWIAYQVQDSLFSLNI